MLAEEGVYRLVAQKLGLAPQLLKRRIAALEEQLQFRIFETHGDHASVTPEGKAFIAASREFVREARRTKTRKK